MRHKLLAHGPARTYAVAFDPDEEVVGGLTEFAREHALSGSRFTAIGALRDVTLGYWQPDRKEYRRIPVGEQVEVLSLGGNIAIGPDGAPKLHAHIVVGKSDGSAWGGHLLEGHVRPTLEVVLEESPEELQRAVDPETGLTVLVM